LPGLTVLYSLRRWLDLRDASPSFALSEASSALRGVSPGDWIGVAVKDEKAVDELSCWSWLTSHDFHCEVAPRGRVCWIRRPPIVPD
jgi:hypothetical protein